MEYPSTDGIERVPEEMCRKIFGELLHYSSRKHPYWIQVMGIPGAGKTELIRILQEELAFRKPHTLAATDEYMEALPGFHEMKDRDEAFRTFDPVASALGLEVHKRLIAQKSDVLFERSLAHPAYRDVMYMVKKSGYTLVVVLVRVSTQVAKQRTLKRAQETNRHIPESVIDERVLLVEERWMEMKKIADYTVEVENNGEVSAYNALKNTAMMVTDFIRTLKADKTLQR
jgi:predicted ABC-type ATPase